MAVTVTYVGGGVININNPPNYYKDTIEKVVDSSGPQYFRVTRDVYNNWVLTNTIVNEPSIFDFDINKFISEMQAASQQGTGFYRPCIPTNTVSISSPVDLSAYDLADGLIGLCTGCDKLETFDCASYFTYSNFIGHTHVAAFAGCTSLRTVDVGDYFKDYVALGNTLGGGDTASHCFYNCANLESIDGIIAFSDDDNIPNYSNTGTFKWTSLVTKSPGMFYGCKKLTGVKIKILGDSTSFINDKVYEYLGLARSQFTLVWIWQTLKNVL